MQPKETQRFLKELVTGFRWPSHRVGVLSPGLLLPLCVSRWLSPALSSSCESILWISSFLCMETLKMLSVPCRGSVWKLAPTSSCPFQMWRPLVLCFSLQGSLVASHLQNVLAKQIAGPCPRTLLPRSSKSPGAAAGQGPRVRATNQKKASSGFTYFSFTAWPVPTCTLFPLLLTSTCQFQWELCAPSYLSLWVTGPHPLYFLWLLVQHCLQLCPSLLVGSFEFLFWNLFYPPWNSFFSGN